MAYQLNLQNLVLILTEKHSGCKKIKCFYLRSDFATLISLLHNRRWSLTLSISSRDQCIVLLYLELSVCCTIRSHIWPCAHWKTKKINEWNENLQTSMCRNLLFIWLCCFFQQVGKDLAAWGKSHHAVRCWSICTVKVGQKWYLLICAEKHFSEKVLKTMGHLLFAHYIHLKANV